MHPCPFLGTVIAASLIVAIFETLSNLAGKARAVIQSTKFPSLLSPLTYLAPILSLVATSTDIFGGYCLCHTGLTGDEMMLSAKRAKDLLLSNGTLGFAESGLHHSTSETSCLLSDDLCANLQIF